jgi:[acyl-carrier-protein] S-malonyltransferase
MSKIGFVFSGQGSQYIGMGKELYENIPACRKVFEEADDVLGLSISKMCFEGPKEDLDKTENTQPAVVAVSTAALRALEESGIKAEVAAGFSLGEYSALICSGALNFKDGISLVKKRGAFMQSAVPVGIGTMAAVLGLERDIVINCCQRAGTEGVVEAVNFNCPGQIVIAGEVKAVEKAVELAKAEGASRSLMLPVSAPFHSSMLSPAAQKLKEELEKIQIGELRLPVLANVNADYINSVDDIRGLLVKQAMSPVLWEDIIRKMLKDGVDTFIELGPGRTLSGFIKKIDRKVTTLNVEDLKSLEKTLETLHK